MYAKAKRHFKKTDPILHRAAQEHEIEAVAPSDDLFRDIIWTIIGQQLSSRAANAIFERFERLFTRRGITSRAVLNISDAQMRACGLSGAKVRAIRNVAEAVQNEMLELGTIADLNDELVLAELTKIKGIGPWTAEMVLMFSLGRPDIFSAGDLGLRKGIVHLYGLKKFPSDKKIAAITKKWSPYRTYAARVLWKIADAKKPRVGRKRPRN